MGQGYLVCNLDKRQYLNPHRFGDGYKLMEFGCSQNGTMLGLAVLLAEGNGRGGGDLQSKDPIVGSWARDRIVIAGDYADPEPDTLGSNLWSIAAGEHSGWTEISDRVLLALADDPYVAADLSEAGAWHKEQMGKELLYRLERVGKKTVPGRFSDPLHVQLAHEVLRNSEEPDAWAALLDACLERRETDEMARLAKKEEAAIRKQAR